MYVHKQTRVKRWSVRISITLEIINRLSCRREGSGWSCSWFPRLADIFLFCCCWFVKKKPVVVLLPARNDGRSCTRSVFLSRRLFLFCFLLSLLCGGLFCLFVTVSSGVGGPEGEVVTQQLHDQGWVFVRVLVQCVKLSDSVVKGLEKTKKKSVIFDKRNQNQLKWKPILLATKKTSVFSIYNFFE